MGRRFFCSVTVLILTVVYMTFFPNDEIRKFFPGFDGTLSIQYHELRLINIVLPYPIPWLSISNLIHKIVLCIVLGSIVVGIAYGCLKKKIMELFLLFCDVCFIVFISVILFVCIVC